jgi:transposase-like protein
MSQERRHFSPEDKVKILREHLLEKKPISEVCQKHQIQPTLFYLWQKTFFENGAAAFERSSRRAPSVEERKIEKLESKLKHKDEVMAELLTEHIMLKKSLGES